MFITLVIAMINRVKTFDLVSAAKFLHMSPEVLRQKAKNRLIKAAKPGKRWVFLESDLAEYLQALYDCHGQAPQSDTQMEVTQCHSINAATSTGYDSRAPVDKGYVALLELKTK